MKIHEANRGIGSILITMFMVIFTMISSLTVCSSSNTASKEGEVFIGIISLKGNEPHSYLLLKTDEGKMYKITGQVSNELRKSYQKKKIKIKGELISDQQGIILGEIRADYIIN
jgi:uncharacterized protein (DUF2147 family)